MSFKKQRRCSRLEHHEGDHPLGKSDEKPPMENGDIVLTNMVSVTILHCFSIQPDFSNSLMSWPLMSTLCSDFYTSGDLSM